MSKLKMYTATAKECTKKPLTQTLLKNLNMFLCTFWTDFVSFSIGNAYERRHILYIVDLFVWRILLLLPWHFSFSYLFAECKAKAKHYFDSYLLTYVKALWERTNDSKQLDKQFWARHLVNNKTLSFFNKQNCYKYNNQNKFHFWRVDTSCSM
jgi:hypothetical protein